MSKAGSISADPRWLPFIERYALDLYLFSIEVCALPLTPQQKEMVSSISEPASRTSVASGHGTGKTTVYSVICLWHLLCYPYSVTVLTAPKIGQIRTQVWKEISKNFTQRIPSGVHPWIADYFTVETEKVFINGHKLSWFIEARTAPKGSPENLAGVHAKWLLILADEASGIPDANFKVLTGALTEENNRMAMASQPTRSSGYFYDSHHRLSRQQNPETGTWSALSFNSEHSPLVTEKFISEKREEYTKEEYEIKVKGRFPDKIDGFLNSRSEIERCFNIAPCIDNEESWGWVNSSDLGGGGWRDSSTLIEARVIGQDDYGADARRVHVEAVPFYTNSINESRFRDEIYTHIKDSGRISETLAIDEGGSGRIVKADLESKYGMPNVKGILWGEPCFSRNNRERFINLRAQACCFAARAAQEGRLTFSSDIPLRIKNQIINEGSRIPYDYDGDKARRKIQKKDKMREDGIPSPDLWDSICFLFMEGVLYTPSLDSGDYSDSEAREKNRVREVAKDMFANID